MTASNGDLERACGPFGPWPLPEAASHGDKHPRRRLTWFTVITALGIAAAAWRHRTAPHT
jgi:hypothetical protein